MEPNARGFSRRARAERHGEGRETPEGGGAGAVATVCGAQRSPRRDEGLPPDTGAGEAGAGPAGDTPQSREAISRMKTYQKEKKWSLCGVSPGPQTPWIRRGVRHPNSSVSPLGCADVVRGRRVNARQRVRLVHNGSENLTQHTKSDPTPDE